MKRHCVCSHGETQVPQLLAGVLSGLLMSHLASSLQKSGGFGLSDSGLQADSGCSFTGGNDTSLSESPVVWLSRSKDEDKAAVNAGL